MFSLERRKKKKKKISHFSHYLYWSTAVSKNAVGEILSVCFCKIKCLDLWNAEMQGRRENGHLYHAGMNISKYKSVSKAFFILLEEMTFVLMAHY